MSKGKLARAVSEQYTLKEVERTLRNRELLYTYAESGDLDAVDTLVDVERALALAEPTETQLLTATLYWGEGLTLKETGEILGVTPQAVRFNLNLLKVKIKKVLDKWEKRAKKEELHGR